MAIENPQRTPIAGMSTGKDVIAINDKSIDWKDVSSSTAAARLKKKADKAAEKAALYAKKAGDKAAQKAVEATKAEEAEKAAKAAQQWKAASKAAIVGGLSPRTLLLLPPRKVKRLD